MKTNNQDLTDISYPSQYEMVRIPEQKCFPPRSFQGYEPLAYVRDIITLQKRVVKWLTGSDDPFAISSLISSYGFLPLNVSGLADSKYFGVQTEYNTKLINNKVINYNFYGKNVKVSQSTERTDKVNIYIRKLKCASNLGTTDGVSDGNVYLSQLTNENITTGQLPDLYSLTDPKINFGDWSDREYINIDKYNTNRFEVETTDYINFASSGTFFVISLLTPENAKNQVVQSQIITPGMMSASLSAVSGCSDIALAGQNQNIIFSINDWLTDDGDTYKAKIKVSFNINNIFADESYQVGVKPTRFKINIAHHNYDVTSFGTFLNWDKWLQEDPQINQYIKDNIYKWQSKDYLYITGQQITYQNFWYEFQNDKHFKTSNIDQIYNGNIIFHIDNISALYKMTTVNNNIQFKTNISSEPISTELIPTANLYQANQEINFIYKTPIKQNFYGNKISAQFTLRNAYSSLTEIKEIQLSTIINTLSCNNFSNEINEYFYDEDKLNNEKFGQKYRITDHIIDITSGDLQVIPGSGLFYNQNEQEYIRQFTISGLSILQFINLHVLDYNIFLNNIKININNNWENLSNYIDNIFYQNNCLQCIFKNINQSPLQIKIIINNSIAITKQLICSQINVINKPTDIETNINNLLLEIEYIKTLLK